MEFEHRNNKTMRAIRPSSLGEPFTEELVDSVGRRKPDSSAYSVRDVARTLGIGRTRVIQLEHTALAKMRRALKREDNSLAGDADPMYFENYEKDTSIVTNGDECEKKLFPRRKGWLIANNIASLNDGSECPEDVARTFNYLHADHERIVKPPVYVSGPRGLSRRYYIRGAVTSGGKLLIRCVNSIRGCRSVRELRNYRCIVVVDSVSGRDDEGEFDIPVLICAILTFS